jgi:hypothetical protein
MIRSSAREEGLRINTGDGGVVSVDYSLFARLSTCGPSIRP